MNTGWNGISGNWLSTGLASRLNNALRSENFDPYTTAPATAHIMWTKPYAIPALIGGNYGVAGSDQYTNYYSTPQYEPKFIPPIIINGVLYYNLYPGSSTSLEGWVAVDLYTGQTLWTQNYTTINFKMSQGSSITSHPISTAASRTFGATTTTHHGDVRCNDRRLDIEHYRRT